MFGAAYFCLLSGKKKMINQKKQWTENMKYVLLSLCLQEKLW